MISPPHLHRCTNVYGYATLCDKLTRNYTKTKLKHLRFPSPAPLHEGVNVGKDGRRVKVPGVPGPEAHRGGRLVVGALPGLGGRDGLAQGADLICFCFGAVGGKL